MDKFLMSQSKEREGNSGSHTEPKVETTASASGNESDNDTASTSTTGIPRKRRKISIVWKYFKKSADKRFAKCLSCEGVTKLKEIIKNINFFAITTDCWTSISTESYISVTCHFIDQNYDLKTAILAVKQMTSNHTSQNMADALVEVFQD
ncbi:unnamed protein product [Psylliodes chrysocephalus]|uniref:Uncharacterized protein n=1 Tax=Psylliodes chrysocephalus TaxID=3402493 RepID=A0A9P0GK22_9CUCU|nr:unnamed protein product [Psylliodes chrysocephala]